MGPSIVATIALRSAKRCASSASVLPGSSASSRPIARSVPAACAMPRPKTRIARRICASETPAARKAFAVRIASTSRSESATASGSGSGRPCARRIASSLASGMPASRATSRVVWRGGPSMSRSASRKTSSPSATAERSSASVAPSDSRRSSSSSRAARSSPSRPSNSPSPAKSPPIRGSLDAAPRSPTGGTAMAPATRRRRMPAAQRREEILAAAEETFGRCGYHGASLDDVAHAAGVSKALIYEHFISKRELHGSLLDAQAEEIFARVEAAVQRGETGEQRLRNGIDAFLAFVEEHREAWRALFRDAADPEVGALVARVQHRATGVVARLIAAGPSAAAADDGGAGLEIHAQMLSGAVQSLATWWHDHREVPRELLVELGSELCWHGVARGGEAPEAAVPAVPVSAPAR